MQHFYTFTTLSYKQQLKSRQEFVVVVAGFVIPMMTRVSCGKCWCGRGSRRVVDAFVFVQLYHAPL